MSLKPTTGFTSTGLAPSTKYEKPSVGAAGTEHQLEKQVRHDILEHFGLRPEITLFPNPVGSGWVGSPQGQYKNSEAGESIVIKNFRRINFGLRPGSSDLIGWLTVRLGCGTSGKVIAAFLAFELKSPTGRPSPEQLNFIEQVRRAGGIAGVVRSIEDAEKLIADYIRKYV